MTTTDNSTSQKSQLVSKKVRNRRLNYMQTILVQSDYFSLEAIRIRHYDSYSEYLDAINSSDRDAVPCERAYEELITSMKERFLEGLDEGFDYSEVDASERWDESLVAERDIEDAYFEC